MRRRLDWYIDREGEQGTSDNVVGTCMDIEKSYFRLTSVSFSFFSLLIIVQM
ncbi:hypothetical protein SAI_2443 [Streptococcus agalactiae H36B]|nr:hypothetical protein SAI_2443 [Streptococcus agalactiae H36B]